MMPMSAFAAFIASTASGALSDLNWWTLRPFSCAATRSASGRAPSFSGAQNTPATSSLRARNASSTALPKSCWPTMAILMFDSFLTSSGGLFRRHGEGARAAQRLDLRLVVAEHLVQDLIGVLAERGRALDQRGRVGELDRHAHVPPLAALRVVELDPHVAPAHVLVGRQVLARHDRPARHVERVEDRHQLALGVLLGELVEQGPHQVLVLSSV